MALTWPAERPQPCRRRRRRRAGRRADTILGWGKWAVLICGVAGLLISGEEKMAIGHRNRSTLAADGASGIPVE